MKAELFVTGESDSLDRVCGDAMEVMSLFSDESKIECVKTDEGYDLMMGGVEIGSYGERATQSNAWIYGTGIALPRFSVAKAFGTFM